MDSKDYYKILNLSNHASHEEIKQAYRKLAMQYHPDRNHGKEEWANDKIKEINEAFSILGDPKKRRRYDSFGLAGDIGDIFANQDTRTAFEDLADESSGNGLGFDFLDDIFAENLRGTGYGYHRFKRRFGGSRITEFETQGDFNIEDLFEDIQDLKGFNVNYEIILNKGQASNGLERELVRNGKRLKVKIPAGVKTGNKIKLRNALLTTDGRPGDIIVCIEVK